MHAGAGGEGGEVDTQRFRPDKGFAGADYARGQGTGEGGAVQFEREGDEADPFGLDAFLSDVRGGKKKGALDDIGKRGGMGAGGGGGSGYDQEAGGSGRKREFVSGGR